MTDTLLEKTLDSCLLKLRRQLDDLICVHPRFPHAVVGGKWTTSGDDEWKNLVNGYWTGGFWIGMLFLAEKLSDDSDSGDWARRWMDVLAPRAATGGMHDLGFVFLPSAALGYELTGDRKLLDIAEEAASNVTACYSSLYRCIPIFARPPMNRILAIDTMMNLPLLWWVADKTDNEIQRRAARNHAETTIEFLLRDNGSTFHIVKFEEAARYVDEIATWQGRAPDSCWSRGQAWAVSGFAYSSMFSDNKIFQDAFRRSLSFFTDNLPEDLIPYWDLSIECKAIYEWKKEKRDSSALAAAAHALLMLDDETHTETAKLWLRALIAHCLAPEDEPGFLRHVCFHHPANIDTDISCTFADFYFLLSLAIATGKIKPPFKR